MMCHRARKASWNNRVFTSQQRDALRAADERLDAVHLGIKNVADAFANDTEVRNFSSELYSVMRTIALKVRVSPKPGYA